MASKRYKTKTSVLVGTVRRSQVKIHVETVLLTLCLETSLTSFKTRVAMVTVGVRGGSFQAAPSSSVNATGSEIFEN